MTPEDIAALQARAYTTQAPWGVGGIRALLSERTVQCLTTPGAVLVMRCVAQESEVLMLATDPAHQREGRARGLMLRGFDLAREAGCETSFLEVAEANHPARALYASLGYAQVGERRGYYRLRDGSLGDALVLARHLSAEEARRNVT